VLSKRAIHTGAFFIAQTILNYELLRLRTAVIARRILHVATSQIAHRTLHIARGDIAHHE
jgi:hypothetical protein